jgi:hypothetical protein
LTTPAITSRARATRCIDLRRGVANSIPDMISSPVFVLRYFVRRVAGASAPIQNGARRA